MAAASTDPPVSAFRPLLVTGRPYPGTGWADVAADAASGLSLWRERRHAVVLADFGGLGAGMTGMRLARALRAESPAVRVFLLSDKVDPSQLTWARNNGVEGVVQRDAKAIAACLSALFPSPAVTPGSRLSPELVAQVTQALQTRGGVGPAAGLVVEEAIEELSNAIADPSALVRELIARLAAGIRSERARKSFVMHLTGREHADVATI